MAPHTRTRSAVWTHAERTAFEKQIEQQQTLSFQLDQRLQSVEDGMTSAGDRITSAETDMASVSAAAAEYSTAATKDQKKMSELKLRVSTLERGLQRVMTSIQGAAASSTAASPRTQPGSVSDTPPLSGNQHLMPGGASPKAPNGTSNAVTTSILLAQEPECTRNAILEGRRDEYLASLSTRRSIPYPVSPAPLLSHTVPPRRDHRFPAHVFSRRDANKGRRRNSMPPGIKVGKFKRKFSAKRMARRCVKPCLITGLIGGACLATGATGAVAFWLWKNVYHYESRYA